MLNKYKKQKNVKAIFSVSEELITELDQMAEENGLDKGKIVEIAIKNELEKIKKEIRKNQRKGAKND